MRKRGGGLAVVCVSLALALGHARCTLDFQNPGDPLRPSPLLAVLSRGMAGWQAPRAPDSLASLRLWLDADRVIGLADGAAVTTWNDASSSGYTADASDAGCTVDPTFLSAALNGRPAVRFSGLDQECLTLGSNFIFSTNDGLTMAAVLSSTVLSGTSNDFVLDFGNFLPNGFGMYFRANGGGAYFSGAHGGVHLPTVFSRTSGSPVVLAGRVRFGGEQVFRLDGSVEARTFNSLSALSATEIFASSTRMAASGPVTIGGQSQTTSESDRFLAGDLAQIVVYDRALSDAELGALECFFAERYAVALAFACE